GDNKSICSQYKNEINNKSPCCNVLINREMNNNTNINNNNNICNMDNNNNICNMNNNNNICNMNNNNNMCNMNNNNNMCNMNNNNNICNMNNNNNICDMNINHNCCQKNSSLCTSPASLLSLYYLSEHILQFQKGTIKYILQDLRDNCLSNLAYELQNITFQEYYMAIHYLNRYIDESKCYDDIFFLLKVLAKNIEIKKIPSAYNEEQQKEFLNSLTIISKQIKHKRSHEISSNNMNNHSVDDE
ncbi:transcription factor with AP2 domain(s), partial [Plasmodium reichenowi]